MLPTIQELAQMRSINIRDANREQLVDIRNIKINTDRSVTNRVMEYIEKVKNPYLVRVGDYIVKLNYIDTQETANDRMKHYISKLTEVHF